MAVTKWASRYGSSGDSVLPCTLFCAGIALSPPRPACAGTSYCFCVTDSALSNSPAVPVATTSTLSA